MWRTADGRLVPARCGAPNRCDHCAFLTACENALVVKLDADERMPTLGLTLTTHRASFDLGRFRVAVAQLFKWLRQSHPEAQYLGFMEWTTGQRTPGKRPHQHALVKGIVADPVEASCSVAAGRQLRRGEKCGRCLECRVSVRWASYTGGAWVVECRPLRTPAGAIAYLAHHHHKGDQAPPPGFTGKRLRPSRGYYARPIDELREEARRVLRDKRAAAAMKAAFDFEALEDQALPEDVIEDALSNAIARARREPVPELVRVAEMPADFGDDGLPVRWERQVIGLVH